MRLLPSTTGNIHMLSGLTREGIIPDQVNRDPKANNYPNKRRRSDQDFLEKSPQAF